MYLLHLIDTMMKRYMVSITEEMEARIERERKERLLETIPETIRVILSEYLKLKAHRE